MQMVHRLDPGPLAECGTDLGDVEIRGNRLEQRHGPRRAADCQAAAITRTEITMDDGRIEPVGAEERDCPSPATMTPTEPSASREQVPERAAQIDVVVRVPEERRRARRR